MDPFTDMMEAFGQHRVDFLDLTRWLQERAEYGAPASLLCRVSEFGSDLCNISIDNAYHIAYMLGILGG